MPEKSGCCRLIRGKTGRVYGNLIALLTIMKGLPLSYNRDLQEDKLPVFDTVDTVKSCLIVLNEMFPGILFHMKRMRETAGDAYSTATDIAEYLVRKGIPFRKAHETGKIVLLHWIQTRRFDPEGVADIFPYDRSGSVFLSES
jgi:argininosuccinate lyase